MLPEYRDAVFKSRSGLYIGRDLVLCVMEIFRSSGATEVRAIIDEDNLPSYRLQEKLGWRRGRTGIPGWRHPSGEIIWKPQHDH